MAAKKSGPDSGPYTETDSTNAVLSGEGGSASKAKTAATASKKKLTRSDAIAAVARLGHESRRGPAATEEKLTGQCPAVSGTGEVPPRRSCKREPSPCPPE